MKATVKTMALILSAVIAVTFAGCTKADKGGNEEKNTALSAKKDTSDIKIPEITSEDQVMPTYLDISLYDVENYADVYLGKDFKYKITYGGSEFSVPSTYKNMEEKDWNMIETESVSSDSNLMAGKYLSAQFRNEYGTEITGIFYNSSKSSKSIKKCDIVKFIIPENKIENAQSVYGEFWVNGVSNTSAITDVMECLGTPSHFYCVSGNIYYLDYFLTKKDKRSKITVYVDTADDSVKSIEFSRYE